MSSYFYVHNEIFAVPVSGAAKLVYSYFCYRADKNGGSFPKHKTTAAACGISVTTLKKAVTELETAGLISVKGQMCADRRRTANLYKVNVDCAGNGFFKAYTSVFASVSGDSVSKSASLNGGETLSVKARVAYLYLCRLSGGNGSAFPSHRALAAACELSKRTAREALNELEAAGLIAREARFRADNGQMSNVYTLVLGGNAPFAGGMNMMAAEGNATDSGDTEDTAMSVKEENTADCGEAERDMSDFNEETENIAEQDCPKTSHSPATTQDCSEVSNVPAIVSNCPETSHRPATAQDYSKAAPAQTSEFFFSETSSHMENFNNNSNISQNQNRAPPIVKKTYPPWR